MTTKACQTLVVVACLLCGGVAHAQVARSQFNGTVTDSAGGVLVGATVVATNVETNVESKATTTDAGVYVIPYLPTVSTGSGSTASGFRPAEADGGHAARRADADARLQARRRRDRRSGTVTAPVIETSTAEIGQYVSNKEFQTWPIAVGDGQRQIQQFIFSSLPGTTGGTFEGAINGGRNYSHEILIEGIPLGRNLQGGSNNEMSPPTEAVGRVQAPDRHARRRISAAGRRRSPTSSSSPGRTSSTGRARSYLQDRRVDARPFVAKALNQTTPVRELQNGAVAVGGPIMLPRYQRHGTAASSYHVREDARSASRLPPHSARCPPASSRTATSHACSIRVTPATRDRARSSAPSARTARPFRPDLRSAHDARRGQPRGT